MAGAEGGEWYWCLDHGRAEPADEACGAGQRMGPYRSKHEATHWQDRVEARNEAWDEEDRRWEGDTED